MPSLAARRCTLWLVVMISSTGLLTLGIGGWSRSISREVPVNHASISQGQTTRQVIDNFNAAFNRHDANALAAFLTDDTVFEDTSPAPDGRRVEGKADVVDFWRGWFARNPDERFDAEDVIISGNRAVVLWVYRKVRNGQPWDLRGVDIFTVRDGKVAAKLAYVKG